MSGPMHVSGHIHELTHAGERDHEWTYACEWTHTRIDTCGGAFFVYDGYLQMCPGVAS